MGYRHDNGFTETKGRMTITMEVNHEILQKELHTARISLGMQSRQKKLSFGNFQSSTPSLIGCNDVGSHFFDFTQNSYTLLYHPKSNPFKLTIQVRRKPNDRSYHEHEFIFQ